MDEATKDTLQSVAPNGTPTSAETQSSTVPATGNPTSGAAPAGTPEPRRYAGKYDSPEALEEAHKNLESKLGSKSYLERVGEKLVEKTGYTPTDLVNAGYSEEQVVMAMLGQNPGQPQGSPTPSTSQSTVDAIRGAVENSKVDSIQFELELERLYRKDPDAENLDDVIRTLRKHPDFRGKSPAEVLAGAKALVKRGEEIAYSRQDEKERANVTISNASVPQTSDYDRAVDRYKRTGDADDATAVVFQRLFGKKG
jgi:hypothetical protein